MSAGTGDDAPRLPPRPARTSAGDQLALELPPTHPIRAAAAHLDADWPAFEEPPLLALRAARLALLLARVAAFAWSIAVVVFALRVRANAGDDVEEASVDGLAWLGPVVAGLIAVTGWFWSDRVTRNVHRLGGRLPTRVRCVSAWALPLAWAGLLWLTVLRMEPTEVFDVRPLIVVVLIALTVWRPYSLVRRILTTLTRIRSDALIGTGYVFDLSAFGLLWWQLASWSSDAGTIDAGQADVLLGGAAAAAVGFGLNVAVWVLLTLDVERAEGDRLLALRTRHDHRHLRLRGINPMDPEVRWALLRIRQEEELERRAAEQQQRERRDAPAPPTPEEWRPEQSSPEPVTIDPLGVAHGAVEPATDQPVDVPEPAAEWARPAEPEPEVAAETPPGEVTPLVAEILEGDASDQIIADLVGEIATAETSAQILADLVNEVASESLPGIGVEPVARDQGADSDTAAVPAESEPHSEVAARLRARLTSGREPRPTKRLYPTVQPIEGEAPVSRLARRLDMAGAESAASSRELSAARFTSDSAGGDDITSRRDRFAQRLNVSEGDTPSQRTLLARLEEYGITARAPTDVEPMVPLADEFRHDEERWIPPRLYELEAVRYLLLIGIVVIAVTSAWIVTRTVSASGQLVAGDIVGGDVDRINVARRAFVTSLSLTFVLVALWCAVFVSHARRAGAPDTREWRIYSLLALTVALNVFSFVTDGDRRGTTSLLCVMGCLLAALIAVGLTSPIARWFERRTIGLVMWAAGLAFVTIISWLGGLQRPVEATDALEALTFVAALQAIATAVVVVVAAVSTSDLEDAIRLSPQMAEPIQAAPPAQRA